MSKPINVLTGIDYWLDNLMCNVPELAMCYHDNGIVQVSCTCHLMSAFFPLQSVRLRDSFGFTIRGTSHGPVSVRHKSVFYKNG